MLNLNLVSSYLNCYNDHLAVLLKNTKCLLAVSCGITLTHLQSAMQQMTKYSSPVEQLDLSFNLCGNSSQKGFKDVFLWLATNFKHLKDLNCSYCAGKILSTLITSQRKILVLLIIIIIVKFFFKIFTIVNIFDRY